MHINRKFIITVRGYKLKDNTIYVPGGRRYRLDPNNQATTFYPNCQYAYIQLLKIDNNYWQINQYKVL